jgi:hypothetical protein
MAHVHVVHIYLHVNCTHNRMAKKWYNIKFIIANMIEIVVNDNQLYVNYIMISCKRQDF